MSTRELTCQEVVELVTDYLEGSMAPSDRDRFDAHLAFCSWCTTFVDQMRKTIELTGSLRADDLPEDVQERLVDAFRNWRRNS